MTISIPCPQCGAILKLRDSTYLGKTGKCPKCDHRFLLKDPDEIEMELVESPAPSAARRAVGPKLGTGAVWVPDDGATSPPNLVQSELPGLPQPEPVVTTAAPSVGGSRSKRKRRNSNLPRTLTAIAAVVLVIGGIAWGLNSFDSANPDEKSGHKKIAAAKHKEHSDSADDGEGSSDAAKPDADHHEFGRPTHGQPIELLWVPSGARIIISLKPSELWKAGAKGEGEFKAGFGPLGTALENWMKTEGMSDPTLVEHALIALIPGERGTPPDIAAVITRLPEHKFPKSELIDKFGGQAAGAGSLKYYTNEKRAMVLQSNMLTYAICPAGLAEEMVTASKTPKPTDGGIEELLRRTDRDLQFTLVCIPADLRIHGEFLAPPNAQPFIQNVADWISSDDEAEAVALSFHLTDKEFYMQMLARNSAITKPNLLAKAYKSRLDATPRRILEAIRMMKPTQVGFRRVIGRVPAMSKVVQLGTKVETQPRLVSLAYTGPERAGVNLAIGTLLAWDESTRTNFGATPTDDGTTMAKAKTLKELLKTKIEFDFNRKPLEEAFNYIANEANFNIVVDGDALKAVGYTKNIAQTYKAENITASAALKMVVSQPKQDLMCFVIDESKNLVTVTTIPTAKEKNLKIYEMK